MSSIASKGQPRQAAGAPDDNGQHFDLLLDQIVDYAIFLLDPEGIVRTWNKGAERIKGYQRDEIVGRPYNTFFAEEDRTARRPEQILKRAIAEGRYQEEGWRVRKDGTRFWASIVLTALRGPSGELRGLAKITRDLTEKMKAEERARELVRARALHEQAERDAQERETLRRHRAQLANLRSAVSNFAARATSVESMMDGCAHAVVEHLEAVLAQIWLTDTHGTLALVAHRGMEELASELPSTRSWMDLVAADGHPVLRDDLHSMPSFARARDAGTTSLAAHPILNGTKVVGVLAVFSRTPLSAETLDAMRGVTENLVHWMERRRAEDEVQQSRDQLNLILRSISEGVSVQGPSGDWVFVNDAAARLCGCESAREMLSMRRTDLLNRFEIRREDGAPLRPDDLPGRIALQGKPSNAVLRFKTKPGGEERWSYVSAAPVINAYGQVELAVSIFHEFTERRRSEQAWQFLAQASATLGSSLDFAATLTQVANLAVPAIADWCSLELLAEDGALEQLAVTHVDPSKVELAREWRRRWPPGRQAIPYQVIASGVSHLLAEITDDMIDASTTDPEQRRLARELGLRSAMVVPLVVGSKPFGVLSFVSAESGRRYNAQDLIMATEIGRRASLAVENARAYGEVRTAVRTRDTFLSIASHELRTPLSVMTILMSSLVRAANQGRLMALGPDGLRDRLVKAERQTGQLSQLVDRLLDVTRLSSGGMTLERTELDLGVLAREVVSRFDEVASRAGCRIDLKVEGDTTGRWDRSRVDQILTNLLSNAIKYGNGAPVHVLVAGGAADVRLTVEDEGPGLAAGDQARVFKQFERAASTGVPGMGLGLWIVERIAAAHGGTVALDSAPGKGATFTVLLPRARVAAIESGPNLP